MFMYTGTAGIQHNENIINMNSAWGECKDKQVVALSFTSERQLFMVDFHNRLVFIRCSSITNQDASIIKSSNTFSHSYSLIGNVWVGTYCRLQQLSFSWVSSYCYRETTAVFKWINHFKFCFRLWGQCCILEGRRLRFSGHMWYSRKLSSTHFLSWMNYVNGPTTFPPLHSVKFISQHLPFILMRCLNRSSTLPEAEVSGPQFSTGLEVVVYIGNLLLGKSTNLVSKVFTHVDSSFQSK